MLTIFSAVVAAFIILIVLALLACLWEERASSDATHSNQPAGPVQDRGPGTTLSGIRRHESGSPAPVDFRSGLENPVGTDALAPRGFEAVQQKPAGQGAAERQAIALLTIQRDVTPFVKEREGSEDGRGPVAPAERTGIVLPFAARQVQEPSGTDERLTPVQQLKHRAADIDARLLGIKKTVQWLRDANGARSDRQIGA